ncbi:hypothetical protein AMATHDRAFT_4676 [Amanita thiersii Skay4041]|uniref:Ubiquitin carboxyl-terminal hydrolase n=1 Tax=Amanita thiersii Skay4041 TaxID=703135 RepID=A0A2A9NGB9_9AGAR|nr:hypothetical protein AMATHDRAFT_4676 [Amanita thiersii Skay4041]
MARARWRFGISPQQPPQEPQKPPPSELHTPDAKKFGLENFGNTCYANSVLQSLYFCAPFRDLILQALDRPSSQLPSETPPPASSKLSTSSPPALAPIRRKAPESPENVLQHPIYAIPSSPPTLFSALRSLFFYISSHPSEKGTVSPRAFIDKLKEVNELFRTSMHQDAHEFLNYLLNKIVEEVEDEKRLLQQRGIPADDLLDSITTLGSSNAPPTIVTTRTTSSNSGTSHQDATLVHKLFEGILTSETRCLTCETVSSRDESFLDLSIDIEQNSSVTACLRQFSASEMLSQRNKFFCDSCCDLQEAEKRMKIKKLPNVLALHLKRFKYQEDVQRYIKLTYRVAFPLELRLFNTVDDVEDADRLYNLFAIVVHIGNGPHHGHYISIIKTLGRWFVFDDDNVYSIPEHDISKYFGDSNAGSAYVLYYQAADINLASLGLRTQPPAGEVMDIPRSSNSASAASRPSSPTDHRDLSFVSTPTRPPGLEQEVEIDAHKKSEISDTPPKISPHSAEEQSSTNVDPNDTPSPVIINGTHGHPDQSLSPTSLHPNKIGGIFRPIPRPKTYNPDNHKKPVFPGQAPAFNGDRHASKHSPPLAPTPASPQRPSTSASSSPRPFINKDKEREKHNVALQKERHKHAEHNESERKPGTWFKRKSFRLGDKKRPMSAGGSVLPPSPPFVRKGEGVPQTTSSSTSLQNGASPSESTHHRQERKNLEIDADRLHVNSSAAPHSSVHHTEDPMLVPQRRYTHHHQKPAHLKNGDDSVSPGGSISSYGSVSVSQSPLPSSNLPSAPSSPPSLSSLRPNNVSSFTSSTIPEPAREVLEHRKSMPDTHSAKSKYSRPLPPLPPLPHSPSPDVPIAHLSRHQQASPDHHGTNGKIYVTEPESIPHVATSSAVPVHSKKKSASYSTGPASTHPVHTTHSTHFHAHGFNIPLLSNEAKDGLNSAGLQIKRATRKLSLTAPILGFGKRDKDRHREKDKKGS